MRRVRVFPLYSFIFLCCKSIDFVVPLLVLCCFSVCLLQFFQVGVLLCSLCTCAFFLWGKSFELLWEPTDFFLLLLLSSSGKLHVLIVYIDKIVSLKMWMESYAVLSYSPLEIHELLSFLCVTRLLLEYIWWAKMSLQHIVCLYDDDWERHPMFLWLSTRCVVSSTMFPLSSQTRYFQHTCLASVPVPLIKLLGRVCCPPLSRPVFSYIE